ncbi:MAG: PQQ-dependent sugar dehydrogenase [Tahibacter sp.]
MPSARHWLASLGMVLSSSSVAQTPPEIEFDLVASGLDRVTGITATAVLPETVWITEQVGRVRVVQNGILRAQPFLDLTGIVLSSGFEQGLTGFALSPAFPANPFVYVHYIRADNASVVARFHTLPGPLLAADPLSQTVLLTLVEPHPTHNCNEVKFGPDGYLYIGCGDGGPPFTPVYDPQALNDLHGKILRIDVNNIPIGQNYGIPADNPYVGTPGALPEIWALGLRNPYRFNFDVLTGDLWLADVGQSTYEEIDWVPSGTPSGINFGWNRMEGFHCYPAEPCNQHGLQPPVIEYTHDVGCAVIGGLRVRNSDVPPAEGAYIYADFCTGTIYATRPQDNAWAVQSLGIIAAMPTSFGITAQGQLWIGTYGVGDAKVYRILQVERIFQDGFESKNSERNQAARAIPSRI